MKKFNIQDNDLFEYSKDSFRRALPWILFGLGGVFLTIGIFAVNEKDHENWKYFWIKLGEIMLISGIFSYLTTIAEFIGVFKTTVQNILYSYHYLENHKKIDDIWNKVTKALLKSKFPSISDKLLKTITDHYLPIEDGIYYENFKIDLNIDWDGNDQQFVKTQETFSFNLHTESTDLILLPISTWLNVAGLKENTDYYLKLTNCIVNGSAVKNPSYNPDSKEDNHQCVLLHSSGSLELKGSNAYYVQYTKEKRYLFDNDSDKSFRAKFIVNNLDVSVTFPGDDLSAKLICRGTALDYKCIHNSNGKLVYRYDGLILPRQGYVLAFNRITPEYREHIKKAASKIVGETSGGVVAVSETENNKKS